MKHRYSVAAVYAVRLLPAGVGRSRDAFRIFRREQPGILRLDADGKVRLRYSHRCGDRWLVATTASTTIETGWEIPSVRIVSRRAAGDRR
jgi:hypothetical protein